MHLASINLGQAQRLQSKTRSTTTGIDKKPHPQAVIEPLGLVGDTVADKRHHGGPDQAVYIYSADDYAWWAEQLGTVLEPGTFGENLTFSSLGGEVYIGDRFEVGEVTLEITAPRIPCWVLAEHMGDEGFVKRFRQSQRPGLYARVIQPGTVRTGDPVRKIPASAQMPSLVEVFELWYEKQPSPEALRRVLSAPLAERSRAEFASRLEKLEGLPL